MDLQQQAIDRIKSGESLFLTGGGGRGKSRVIQEVTDFRTVVTAPTGTAALNVEGITCHKAFNLPLGIPTAKDLTTVSRTMREVFSVARRIILDEVSMLRPDYLEIIDVKLKILAGNNKPFGGYQVVAVGDFAQLEPVITSRESKEFYNKFKTPFCFDSKVWNFPTLELLKSYRHDSLEQVEVLDSIRLKDDNVQDSIELINSWSKPYEPTEDTLHLCCYKNDAQGINKYWYKKVKGVEQSYLGAVVGKFNDSEKSVPDNLKLKVGTRVLIKANDLDGAYANGSRGIIKSLLPNSVIVTLVDGQDVEVVPFTWEKFKYTKSGDGLDKEVEGTYTQLPILLGWAITVHASQGMTLDDVALDFGRGCFSHGQAYTALSRIRDLSNLMLVEPLHLDEIICKPEVQKFYRSS